MQRAVDDRSQCLPVGHGASGSEGCSTLSFTKAQFVRGQFGEGHGEIRRGRQALLHMPEGERGLFDRVDLTCRKEVLGGRLEER